MITDFFVTYDWGLKKSYIHYLEFSKCIEYEEGCKQKAMEEVRFWTGEYSVKNNNKELKKH